MRKPFFSVTKADLRIDYFRGSGKGGQHRNKRDTAVRITHPESGAVGTAQDERSRAQNQKLAFTRMVESTKFQVWLKQEIARRTMDQAAIERKVDNWLRPKFVKVEYGPFDD
jgi:protein subunit release factor B